MIELLGWYIAIGSFTLAFAVFADDTVTDEELTESFAFLVVFCVAWILVWPYCVYVGFFEVGPPAT